MAYADGVLWVADDGSGQVQRIDARTGAALGLPTAVGPSPVAIAVGGGPGLGGRGAGDGGPARRHDGVDRRGPPVVLGGALVDVVADGSTIWVGDIEGRVVRALDPASGAERRPAISVPAGVVRLAVAGNQLWVTGQDDLVTPIDRSTGAVGTAVRVGNGPIGLALAGPALWVANGDDGTVSRLDPTDGHTLGAAVATGHAPVAVGRDGTSLWVLDQDGPDLVQVRAADGHLMGAPVALPLRPRAASPSPPPASGSSASTRPPPSSSPGGRNVKVKGAAEAAITAPGRPHRPPSPPQLPRQ